MSSSDSSSASESSDDDKEDEDEEDESDDPTGAQSNDCSISERSWGQGTRGTQG